MNESVRLLFDNLRDGLLIISSPTQQVLYANPVARQLAKIDIADIIPGWLSTQITSIQKGYYPLPLTFEMSLNSGDSENTPTQITVLNSPVATDYVVILNRSTSLRSPASAINNMAEMLDCELSSPMANLLRAIAEMQEQLKGIHNEQLGVFSSIELVNRKAEDLKASFGQVCLMSQAYKYDPIRSEERITLSSIIDDVLSNVSKLLTSRHVRVCFSGVSDNIPVIYGNKALMTQAIVGYVRQLIMGVDSGAYILFSIKTNGHFVMLTLNNYGRIPPTDKVGHRLPLLSEKQPNREDDRVQLTISMCQRVIELSGGNLRVANNNGFLTSITIELPIGSPKNRSEEYIQQAQRYAEDLATLMKQKNIHDVEV